MAHMYDRVVSIISKQAKDRTDRDIEQIIPWFRKKSDLFKSLHTDVVKDIVKNCVFQECPRDEVVIKQGEMGDCFYIILNGYVSIYIDPAISDADPDSLSTMDTSTTTDSQGEKKELDRSKFGNYIGDITAGKCFGELALINKDCVRNATILTDITCDLLIVNRSLYNRSLKEYQAQEFAERNNFVNDYPLFRNWQQRYKKQMAMSLRKETVPFDTTLVKQGDPVNAMFFILKGQAKLVVDPVQHSQQFRAWYPITENVDDMEKEEARGSVKAEKKNPPERARSADTGAATPSAINRRRNTNRWGRSTELCVIGPVESCGDLELSLDLGTYVQSVVTNQESDVYVLDMKNYERLVIRRNPRTIDAMRLMVETKLNFRCARLMTGQLPLLKLLLYKLRLFTRPKKESENVLDRSKSTMETAWNVLDLQRGPIVDLYGPGTVFYRIRMRERAKKEARTRAQGIVGGARLGFAIKNFGQMRDSDVSIENGGGLMPPEALGRRESEDISNVFSPTFLGAGVHTSEDYSDWASSDIALTQLEEKIRAWHGTFEDGTKACRRAVKMHRFYPEDNKLPKPGKKVLVRKKPRQRVVGFREYSDDDDDEEDDFLASLRDRVMQKSARARSSKEAGELGSDPEEGKSKSRDTGVNKRPTLGVVSFKKDRPKRKYTAEQYESLKETLRHQQRSFGIKAFRPRTANERRESQSRAIPV